MQHPINSSPAQARQTKQQFANREDYLSYELGKAVKELPPLYTRLLAGSISLLLFSAIAWANFSKVDEVATATGELIPDTQVRPVRSLGGGTIAQERINMMKGLITSGAVTRNDYLDAQERLVRAKADVTRAQDDITKANDKVTEAKDKVKSLEKDITGQEQEINQAKQGYQSASNQAARIPSERKTDILTQINKRKEELTTVVGKLEQAKKQRQIETITAPVSGTIYSVKATKGPVQQGEELLSILPEGEDLVLEVKVLNRDIGFIAKKMKAKVKMATFPYQEFGTIDGEVVEVSPNAIIDKDLGLVFPTRIKISRHSIRVRGEEVPFTPGMSASGEIVTGKKSILTFLIEPISRRFNEAFSIR